ncbi:hypothetical protein LSH36_1367g00001 [Paralvinella palmiformis]|uniref:Uncharacterized protein n=1 Tax=Paralvinella palmiformis TaxID=53620 RepID=A0AAD9IUA4_9ANNE|nr:hypothetical protein LSH36_1367g00001 [Paralvinella palmiformis]
MPLSCYSESQSLPPEYRYLSQMEYHWFGIYNGTGSDITLGPLNRQHHGSLITCLAKERGTSDGLSTITSTTLIVLYPPGHIFLTSNITTVIQGIDGIHFNCVLPDDEHGNPDVYFYYWLEPATTEWKNSTQSTLIIDSDVLNATLHDGNWKCKIGNVIGNSTAAEQIIIVNVSPSISISTSNSSEIVEKDNVTLSCFVTSNPLSDIKLYNITDSKTLFIWNDASKAEYQFFIVHCLDTGEYMFTAKNDIPDEHYIMKSPVYIDIKCAPRKAYQLPECCVQGVALGDNYTLEVGIISNPYPLVTSQSWSFVDYNGNLYDNMPDNVNVSVHPGEERLTIVVNLIITDTQTINYGNYSLVAGNTYGNMTPVTLTVAPIGPPISPSAPRLMDITSVSIQINWTAGFNGGFEQRFTVLYQGERDNIEYETRIETDPEVSKGDIVAYTLVDYITVQSNDTYNIRIKAENDFQGGSFTYGEMARFSTLVKAVFTKDPEISIVEGRAEIHFIISGSLSHILEENCVMDTNICNKANITVPTKQHLKSSYDPDVHDFSVNVPLADSKFTEFIFSFWMYDGEYMLYQDAHSIVVDITGIASAKESFADYVNVAPLYEEIRTVFSHEEEKRNILNSCIRPKQDNSANGQQTMPTSTSGQADAGIQEYAHLGNLLVPGPIERQNTEYERLAVATPHV